jgi:ectoine hydroxylase-related dioxygenase (phytanoyl-CoA dioxygenase family)
VSGGHQQGFQIRDSVLGKSSVEALTDAITDPRLQRSRAGARHLLNLPAIKTLANTPSLKSIADGWLGADAIPLRATLFDKSAEKNWLVAWHQDTALPVAERRDVSGWGPFSIKGGVLHAIAPAEALSRIVAIRVQLDDSTADNGPLRVLPGTHSHGVLSDDEIDRLALTIEPAECTAVAGGLIVMWPLIVHASSKSRNDHPRRVIHIEYAASQRLAGMELALS